MTTTTPTPTETEPIAPPGEEAPEGREVPQQERIAQQIANAVPRSPRQVLRQVRHDFALLRATKYGVAPFVVFFFLDYVQTFDSAITSILLPEIREDLDTSLTALTLYGQLFALVGVPFALLVGYLTDRTRRTRLIAIGNVLSGGFSAVKAMAPNAFAYQGATMLDNFGEGVNNAPTQSLLYDYYPIDARAKVIALRQFGLRVGGFATPVLVGFAGVRYGWRTCLLIVAPLLILSGLIAAGRLREPVRGYWERMRAGEDEASAGLEQPPMSFGEATRTILAVKTVRRILVLFPLRVLGSGFAALFPFFYKEEFGLDAFQRSLLSVPAGVIGLIALLTGGALADIFIRRNPAKVIQISAFLNLAQAFSSVIIVLVPNLVLVILFGIVFAVVDNLVSPAQAVVGSLVVPSRVRGQAVAVFIVPAILSLPIAVLPAYVADTYGLRTALFLFAPVYLFSAALSLTLVRFFEADTRSAIAAANATNEYNRAKKAGQIKLLLARDVDVAYGGVQVLFGVDLTVDEGEMVALLGTNGAGKSTLLRAISGTQEADSGAIFFNGREITHTPPQEIARRGIVHMPGGRCVFPSLTVRENLDLAVLELERGAETDARRDEVYRLFPVLKERLDQRAGSLSGGEQQMIGLAQAFLWKPRLLMIDELSLGLSPVVVGQLLEVVEAINREGTTVILVEQSVNVALSLCERAVFMEKGEIRFDGPTSELLRRPDVMRAVYLKGSSALVRSRRSDRPAVISPDRGRAILEVEGLALSYGGNRAVDGVSFTLHEGEALGLIGPNGAGKTTVFDLISGYQPADSGRVVFDGVDITRMPPHERGNLGLVRRFQDAKLFQSLTVFEAVCVALDRQLPVRSTFLTALQLRGVRDGERRIRVRADRLVDMLELGAYRDKFVSDLSTGVRRVVDLACVLAADPRVLLLDEPSSGIAQAEAEGLVPLLRRIRYETGCSLLLIEHDMPLISAVSDELIALVTGRVVTRGPAEEVLEHPLVVEAYLGGNEAAVKRSGVLPS